MLTEKIKDIGENMTIDIKMIEQTAENPCRNFGKNFH